MTMDLVSKAVGGQVVACTDEFFAPASNLLEVSDPVWREGEYTDRGKWMDGWETRRRRAPGHDWCVIALGIPGRLKHVTVDTSYFTGNYPEAFSLDAHGAETDDPVEVAEWEELIPSTELAGDTRASFRVDNDHRVTHIRLNIYPDGGIARLGVTGDPIPSIREVCPDGGTVDLASALAGGEAIDASDVHYAPPSNLLRPTVPAGMWDGWETRRRRGPGYDWAAFRLGVRGVVEAVEVDTRYFKGNAPGWVSIHVSEDAKAWREVLARVPVAPDDVALLVLPQPTFASYVRIDLHPDGGLARFRVRGRPDRAAAGAKMILYLDSLFGPGAVRFFHAACASSAWVEMMLSRRPFGSVESVMKAAEESFDQLTEDDWLEAFAGHPRIGERGSDPVSAREQSGVVGASQETLRRLEDMNREYERKFGFTYIVHARGRTAQQMLEVGEKRLGNDLATEVEMGAGEQREITRLRLRRMLCQADAP